MTKFNFWVNYTFKNLHKRQLSSSLSITSKSPTNDSPICI